MSAANKPTSPRLSYIVRSGLHSYVEPYACVGLVVERRPALFTRHFKLVILRMVLYLRDKCASEPQHIFLRKVPAP